MENFESNLNQELSKDFQKEEIKETTQIPQERIERVNED